MGEFRFNVAKGRWAQWAITDATKFGLLLLKVVEADATLKDRDTLAAILAAANTEANFTNYSRKTGITGTLTLDDTNDRVDLSVPDQTWTSAGGATNNALVKLIVFYEVTASDAGRVPLNGSDFVQTTAGTDLTATKDLTYIARAA